MNIKTKKVGFIFDLDGTILDDIPHILNYHIKIANEYNYPLTDELDALLREKTGIPMCTTGSNLVRFKSMNYLGKKIKLPFFSRMKLIINTKTKLSDYVFKCPLVEGTQDTLNFLKDNNVKIGMFTNASRLEIKRIFNGREEILKYFEGNIITKDDVKHKKPHPEGILKLLNKWGLLPHNVIILGDYISDIKAGIKAGIITVGVLSGVGTLELFKKFKPNYVINDISEIPLKFPNLEF
ncbi:MAG: HAD family hydrolase [Promethearchaeota archaeon]